METAKFWIGKLGLQKHPEGGWFREVYRSPESVPHEGLPHRFAGSRNFSTSIYFLLEEEEFSAFHRIKSDETWHYYTGTSAVEIISIENGELVKRIAGPGIEKGEQFQVTIPQSAWFAARLAGNTGFALVGCTVSPGFDFADFELAEQGRLTALFPGLKKVIEQFSR